MTQRVYRDDLRCPHCGSNRTPKDGHSRGKQTPYQVRGRLYRCGQCRYRFTPEGNRSYYAEAVKTQAVRMYVAGVSVSVISRTLGVKGGTVYSWLKKSPDGPDGIAGCPEAAISESRGQGDFL